MGVGPTQNVSRLSDTDPYAENAHNILTTQLIMEAGFAVGFVADAFKGATYVTHQHDMYLGWLDVVRVAQSSVAQPSASGTITPDNVASEKDAWVRIGYSAPGGGGIVWTGAQWLR